MPKKNIITKDKCYLIFQVYAKSIRDVQTDKVSISDKLLDAFLPFINVSIRYTKSIAQLQKSLQEFEKEHPKGSKEYIEKEKEFAEEIKELGKQTVDVPPFMPKNELLDLLKKEPAYKISSGQLYAIYNYET